MRKMWPVLAALVVLTSACRLETNVMINVNEDGTGTFTTELGLDDEMNEILEGFGGSAELLGSLDLGDGATETRIEGDMTYVSSSQSFASIDELKAVVAENEDQATFDEFEFDVDEDGARIVAKLAALAGEDGVDTDSLPFDLSSLSDDAFSASIFVTLPGNVTEHNADEVLADGTLRWKVSVTDPIDIEAESTFGGDGVPWLPIGAAAVAILGIGGFLAMRNRGDKSSEALRATEVPPAPMDFSSSPESAGETTGTGFGEFERPPDLPPSGSA